jgi:hypothetical protein
MPCRKFLPCLLGLALLLVLSVAPATAAVCLANGKPCGNQGLPSNDRLCCPGSVCGWGNACQSACRINGVLYQNGFYNPSNRCQVCRPATSTTAWSPVANGTACNDGNGCTQTDVCQSGSCVGSNPVACTPSDQCHVAGTCNPATGTCSNPRAADGTACNDWNACTGPDTCRYGSCVGANPRVCTSDQCHVAGTCNPATGTCSNPRAADGTACNDGLACTRPDACRYGSCVGTPVACTASDQCHVAGICDPASGNCSNPAAQDGIACNDGDVCTGTDLCFGGLCLGSGPNPDGHCSNGVQDCDETGVDCGGTCPTFCPCTSPCASIYCFNVASLCGADSNGICGCSQTTGASCYCASNRPCNADTACTIDSDCPSGEQCVPNCGCATSVCLPACGSGTLHNLVAPDSSGARPLSR